MKYFGLILATTLSFACQPKDEDQDAPPLEQPGGSELNQGDILKSRFCPTTPTTGDDRAPNHRFDDQLISGKLGGDGLSGYMHGVMEDSGQFVFTYRSEDASDPMAFFKAEEFSLVSRNEGVMNLLKSLNRHDLIKIKGALIPNQSPFRHIGVTALEVIKPYEYSRDYDYQLDPSVFEGQTQVRLLTKVHAVFQNGKGLVLEYQDLILPVLAKDEHLPWTQTMYRNDIILASLEILRHDNRPLHFTTSNHDGQAIQLVDAMKNCHGQVTTLTGTLAKFTKSPQITQDIFAVKVRDDNGIVRNFTFMPSVDFSQPGANEQFMKLFQEISRLSAQSWDASTQTADAARNHEVNPNIQVVVKGTMNVVSSAQANPQIYIQKIEDLAITGIQ